MRALEQVWRGKAEELWPKEHELVDAAASLLSAKAEALGLGDQGAHSPLSQLKSIASRVSDALAQSERGDASVRPGLQAQGHSVVGGSGGVGEGNGSSRGSPGDDLTAAKREAGAHAGQEEGRCVLEGVDGEGAEQGQEKVKSADGEEVSEAASEDERKAGESEEEGAGVGGEEDEREVLHASLRNILGRFLKQLNDKTDAGDGDANCSMAAHSSLHHPDTAASGAKRRRGKADMREVQGRETEFVDVEGDSEPIVHDVRDDDESVSYFDGNQDQNEPERGPSSHDNGADNESGSWENAWVSRSRTL